MREYKSDYSLYYFSEYIYMSICMYICGVGFIYVYNLWVLN